MTLKRLARYITTKIDIAPVVFFLFVSAIIAFCMRLFNYVHFFLTWRVIFIGLLAVFLFATCGMQ